MSVYEHDYGIPSEDELSQLIGAVTPHFAFQARARIAAYAARLPADHPRASELAAQLERLDRLGYRRGNRPRKRPPPPPPAPLPGPPP
ncbi:MAG TPA: hypothetical protein PKE32_04120, partial [Miltoncostaeaceae bacterium]|nr:hypothetical protein [Miltoncostaeaceae bacterium]